MKKNLAKTITVTRALKLFAVGISKSINIESTGITLKERARCNKGVRQLALTEQGKLMWAVKVIKRSYKGFISKYTKLEGLFRFTGKVKDTMIYWAYKKIDAPSEIVTKGLILAI